MTLDPSGEPAEVETRAGRGAGAATTYAAAGVDIEAGDRPSS